MILPSTGTTGSGKSLADGHFDPYLLGPANFFLTVPGITSTTNLFNPKNGDPFISDVTVGFGTGPDTKPFIDTNGTNGPAATPAPPSFVLLALGGLVLGVAAGRSRRREALVS
jgi:MYXO-CTERM domain-containing protein